MSRPKRFDRVGIRYLTDRFLHRHKKLSERRSSREYLSERPSGRVWAVLGSQRRRIAMVRRIPLASPAHLGGMNTTTTTTTTTLFSNSVLKLNPIGEDSVLPHRLWEEWKTPYLVPNRGTGWLLSGPFYPLAPIVLVQGLRSFVVLLPSPTRSSSPMRLWFRRASAGTPKSRRVDWRTRAPGDVERIFPLMDRPCLFP